MYYLDINNQIYFIITLCFSFFIFNFTIALDKEYSFNKRLSSIFLFPILFTIASFLSISATTSASLLALADLLIIYLFLLFLLTETKIKNAKAIQFFLYVLPIVLLFLSLRVPFLLSFLVYPFIFIPLLILGIILNLVLIKKEKNSKDLLFWAMLFALPGTQMMLLTQIEALVIISLLCRVIEFLLFFLFFYNRIYHHLMKKVSDADNKMEEINKSLHLEVRKRTFEIERSNEQLVTISKTDSLTKLLNKATVIDVMSLLIEKKVKNEFSLLMFDIDSFKTINDTHGHQTGDICIKKLATIANSCSRNIDSVGRYGGDEFMIVLPGATSLQAKIIAERLRKKVEETELPHFTISIGIASFPHDGSTVKEIISFADEGLYLSKSKGKNSVSHKNIF